ncbi:mitochondrial ribosome-associated GTPase 2 isoform X1 [Diachasmimorpha longicaudata]|uniref:mitochondrial ribosome-associated GTPase 2 isoform X1 n=1 Tax=Diachasmimorpha longicaudata TaxID=58733 RepID=UPI0030B8FFE6
MQALQRLSSLVIRHSIRKQNPTELCKIIRGVKLHLIREHPRKLFHCTSCFRNDESVALPLRSRKPKSTRDTLQYFVDVKQVRVSGGQGGNGSISFLQAWANEHGGPDGGDGGHGGHVIFQVSRDVTSLNHLKPVITAEEGEKGYNRDCHGKNAQHTVVKVPIGTIIRSTDGNILGDLEEEGMMFIAARGGAGGHGNAFFTSDVQQAPRIAEFGAKGEEKQYVLELRSMAHVGLIGLPNAGKSTLLRAITRARPKVASYPFTTLKPHIGMVQYDDYEQIAVADLPGIIEDSHKNKGLGIMFLKHAERCAALLFILDISLEEPWEQLYILMNEINQFSDKLMERPKIVIANKIDIPGAEEKLQKLKEKIDIPVVAISAKMGTNIPTLLRDLRVMYDQELSKLGNEKSGESSE